MGESDDEWQRMISFFPLKPLHGFRHLGLLRVGTDLISTGSHNPAARK